jgi:hypothetical protein
MIPCKRCGNENPLGRVFCTKCGTKLELTHMTAEHVVEIKRRWSDPIVQHWRKLAAAVAVVAVILVALALWPQTAQIGKEGTRVDGRKVDIGLAGLRTLRTGEVRNLEFTEQDLNGYFKFFKTKMGADSVSVSLQQGYFIVRIIKPIGTIPTPQYKVELKMSYDLILVPYGGRVMPKTVSMGHLSLFDPVRTSILREIVVMFARENDWTNLRNISDVKALPGKLVLQAKK